LPREIHAVAAVGIDALLVLGRVLLNQADGLGGHLLAPPTDVLERLGARERAGPEAAKFLGKADAGVDGVLDRLGRLLEEVVKRVLDLGGHGICSLLGFRKSAIPERRWKLIGFIVQKQHKYCANAQLL